MRNQYLDQKPDVEELITTHMELVRQIAWHMHGRVHASIEIDDLVQIGYYGLVLAAQNYTVQEGATFASYASLRIRGSIVDHLRKNSNLCRTTIQMQQQANKAEMREALIQVAETTLSSKILSGDKAKFSRLAVDAVMRLERVERHARGLRRFDNQAPAHNVADPRDRVRPITVIEARLLLGPRDALQRRQLELRRFPAIGLGRLALDLSH